MSDPTREATPAGSTARRRISSRADGLLPSPMRVRELQLRLLGWYAANRRDLPWRRTADPYAILVSETMLQQTQVSRVVLKYEQFLEQFPTIRHLAEASARSVLHSWLGLGYNARAVRLQLAARSVMAQTAYGDAPRLPTDLPQLLALPGIGPYTARALLIFAHNADLAAVDANVRRVLIHELSLDHAVSQPVVQAVADALLPHGRSRDWHNAMMDYGALVLTSRATGIAPRRRQGAFAGSRRWYRSRLLGMILAGGSLTLVDASRALDLSREQLEAIVIEMLHDGLLVREGDRLTAP